MTADQELNPMNVLQPINFSPKELDETQPLTTVEMGKLWATYVGNSMSIRILPFFLQHCENETIRTLLENGLALSKDFLQRTEVFLKKSHFPIPAGFSQEDVNLDAPRLFEDEFYVHYLKYAAKAGISLYSIAIPLVMREDVREFFIYVTQCTTMFLGQINNVLIGKNLIVKPPIIPIPKKVDYVTKQSFLNGWFGEVRPLHAMEIVHLYDNMENNVTSRALLLGFYQTVKDEKIKELFKRGIDMTGEVLKDVSEKLHAENLQTPSYIDHLVTTSTIPPYSEKIMLFHKVDMFSMKIRSFANSMAVNGRRDISALYGKAIVNVGIFVDDAANILIDHGWMESPPKAFDRG